MKVAVSYNNGLVAKRFSETKEFKIYEVKRGKLINTYILPTEERKGEELAPFLYDNNIDVVFCDCICKAARRSLAKESIIFFPGVV
ncbi:MAG: DNA-binding protein, partial [Firmicutes bacterium]|nr:DNA-binding protein [Bacillota bacterium]